MRERSRVAAECVSAPPTHSLLPSRDLPDRRRGARRRWPRAPRPPDARHDRPQLRRIHVVEEQRGAPASSASSTSAPCGTRPRAAARARPRAPRAPRPHAARHRGVVLLDEDRVEEPGAVVRAAAAATAAFSSSAARASSCACPGCARPSRDRVDVAGGRGRHAGQPAEEVERGALAGEQGGGAPSRSSTGPPSRQAPRRPGACTRPRGRASRTRARPPAGRRSRRAPSA
jgi:hypothetical protein